MNITKIFGGDRKVLESMDPERIYVENVRAYFGIKTSEAEFICEKACSEGIFEEWFAFEHPEHGHVIFETRDGEIDENIEIVCPTCQAQGDEKFEFKLKELRRVLFYRAPR